MDGGREFILEDARSIREGLWRIARLAQDAAESLDARIEDEDLDGKAEAVEVREGLERMQDLHPGSERGARRLPAATRSLTLLREAHS